MVQERKKRTARTTYWRQMGHSASCLEQRVQAAMWPHSSSDGSGAEEAHGAHHVLAADGALRQLLGAARAGGDVAALQQHALQQRWFRSGRSARRAPRTGGRWGTPPAAWSSACRRRCGRTPAARTPAAMVQERKKRTARTTYWRQMGHSASCLEQRVQAAMWPHSSSTHSSSDGSGAEEAHGAHHVLAADGALRQLLGAARAGGDVAALQQHALQQRWFRSGRSARRAPRTGGRWGTPPAAWSSACRRRCGRTPAARTPAAMVQERKKRTARTTYWRQMGHSASCLEQRVQAAMWPHSSSTHSSSDGSGAEEAHGAHHVLAADGALRQLLGAARAGGDVAALQQHALQQRWFRSGRSARRAPRTGGRWGTPPAAWSSACRRRCGRTPAARTPAAMVQERKKRTARTTYWRQMGHSASCLEQRVQAAMWPHSSSTHSSSDGSGAEEAHGAHHVLAADGEKHSNL
ncbi:hypothetical protein RR48_02210 [Papilio machaon]|uniref:Uncharacterized protein n=1 Tax=Papilio machaon TaxID=76193 RepID=A0A0N1IF39_PAPMA|nr:hypothetical protein RR48_02210 [Papilio machaon]